MREINLTKLLPDLVLRFRVRTPIFLTLPPDIPTFCWSDNSLEVLIFKLIDRAISASHPERPIRVAVAKRGRLSDLEALLNIHPSQWIQLRIDVQSLSGFDVGVQEALENSGYSPEHRLTTVDSACQLITYSSINQYKPQLLVWIEDRKANHRYIFLIPITEPAIVQSRSN